MGTENTRLTPIETYVDNMRAGYDVDTRGIEAAGAAVGEYRKGNAVEKYVGALDSAEAEYQKQILDSTRGGAEEDLSELPTNFRKLHTLDPERRSVVYDMYNRIKSEERAVEQGKVNASHLAVRKEKIFRQYSAQYPKYIEDFLRATRSGLSDGLISQETGAMVDVINENSAAQKAQWTEQIAKAGEKYGVFREVGFSDDENGTIDYIMKVMQKTEEADALARAKAVVEGTKGSAVVVKEYLNKSAPLMVAEALGGLQAAVMGQLGIRDIASVDKNLQQGLYTQIPAMVDSWTETNIAKWKADNAGLIAVLTPSEIDFYTKPLRDLGETYKSMVGNKSAYEWIDTVIKSGDAAALYRLAPEDRVIIDLMKGMPANLAEQVINTDQRDRIRVNIMGGAAPGNAAGVAPNGIPNPSSMGQDSATQFNKVMPRAEAEKANNAYLGNQVRIMRSAPEWSMAVGSSVGNFIAQFRSLYGDLEFSKQAYATEKLDVPYLPNDTRVKLLVEGASYPMFVDTYNRMEPDAQKMTRMMVRPVLEQELQYIAATASARIIRPLTEQGTVKPTSSEAPKLDPFLAGAAGMAGAGVGGGAASVANTAVETTKYIELLELAIDPSDGRVFLVRRNDGPVLSPEDKKKVGAVADQFNRMFAPRMTNAVRALKNIGSIGAYEDAMTILAGTDQFPRQLLPDFYTKPAKEKSDAGQ